MASPIIKSISIRDVKFGSNVTLINPVNLYECVISDDCFIGPFVEIQSNVTIGHRTRIQSHTFICSLVEIGKDCFVGHGVTFINDSFQSGKLSEDSTEWKKTIVGDNVLIGSNVTLLPVKITKGCVIGAGSVITKDLQIKGVYAGNPARLIRIL